MAQFAPAAAAPRAPHTQPWQQSAADKHIPITQDAYLDDEESDDEPVEPIRRCFSAPHIDMVASPGVPTLAAGHAESPHKPSARNTSADDLRTTMMLRNIPYTLSRSMLVDILNAEGMQGKYDFLYVPFDFATRQNLGYVFVNMTSAAETQELIDVFDGYSLWPIPSQKTCSVCWSRRQGLDKNVRHFAKSTLLHESVPECHRPLLFEDGQAVPFPVPTRKLARPRPFRA